MEKFIQKFNIQSHQADQNKNASLCALFDYMLDAAWAHAQVMDWGYDLLQSHNMFWVLSRILVKVEKYPSWQDRLTLNTWGAGTDGVYAYREFTIEDENKEILLRANSAWLILNLSNKKIIMLRDFIDTFPRYNADSPCRRPEKIRPYKHPEQMDFYPILFSEIDINKHFNSVRALERVLDGYGIEFLNVHEPETIEINYLKEGLPGDKFAIVTQQLEENEYQSSIVREADKADIITLKMQWRERNNT